MSAAWDLKHIRACAQEMATAREFCGSPSGALMDYQADNDLPRPDLPTREAIGSEYNAIWQSYRREAGVIK